MPPKMPPKKSFVKKSKRFEPSPELFSTEDNLELYQGAPPTPGGEFSDTSLVLPRPRASSTCIQDRPRASSKCIQDRRRLPSTPFPSPIPAASSSSSSSMGVSRFYGEEDSESQFELPNLGLPGKQRSDPQAPVVTMTLEPSAATVMSADEDDPSSVLTAEEEERLLQEDDVPPSPDVASSQPFADVPSSQPFADDVPSSQPIPDEPSSRRERDEGRALGYFTRKQEQNLAEWLQDNPFIYAKAHKDYKNKDRKGRIFQEKATELGVDRDRIHRWLNSRRTQYGRLTRRIEKSGAARENLTEQEKWIIKLFKFMQPHIVSRSARPTSSLGASQVSII